MVTNQSASLLAKIKNAARDHRLAMPTAMRRYAYERMLFLMKEGGLAEGFSLKGGMLMAAMFQGRKLRPTEDLDLNGEKGLSLRDMEDVIRKIATAHDGSDGLIFDIDTLKILKNRDDSTIKGGAITMIARIGNARISIKIDVGYGNSIVPETRMIKYPTLIPSVIPSFEFPGYPIETVISEKLHAAYSHGLLNTRLKDYFDIYHLASNFEINGADLAEALEQTFALKGDTVPNEFIALSDKFAQQPNKEKQWRAFLREADAEDDPSFLETVRYVESFIRPVMEHITKGNPDMNWTPIDGWIEPMKPHGL